MGVLDREREEYFMKQAILLAKEAGEQGDVPVGCVVVRGDEIVGRGRNRREEQGLATAHAEIEAITQANRCLGRWRLEDCQLFVTLEPCSMCTGGIINSKINAVYYGASEPKTGCCGSVINLCQEPLGHKPRIYGGILEEECRAVLQEFFLGLRQE